MSQATKRKHVFQELQDPDFSITPDQKIAKVIASKGNNLHEVYAFFLNKSFQLMHKIQSFA